MIWGLFKKSDKPGEPAPEQAKGLFDGLRKSSNKLADGVSAAFADASAAFTKKKLDHMTLEALEDALLASDMGAAVAGRLAEEVSRKRFGKETDSTEAREALAESIAAILKPRQAALDLTEGPKPRIVLVIGVNGSGKTTTIGKLTKNLTDAGAHVVVGAADTFRAAAIEQLKIWADRAGASFVASQQGADASSVAYDTIARAKAENADVALIDTAGRLQNKSELMAELAKIIRVMRKIDEDAPHETLLVLDATVGQNALSQVENFRSVTDITGLVMTKLDGTAKGGVLVALAQRHAIPIHFIGVGEKAEDLQPFEAQSFARALVGLGTN